MRSSTVSTVLMMTGLFSFQSGCSWINWQKIPDQGISAEKVECRMTPPVVDTVMTAISIIGAGVAFGLGTHACDGPGEKGICGLGEAVGMGVGGVFTGIALILGTSAVTGWSNYNQCVEYRAKVLDSQYHFSDQSQSPVVSPDKPSPPEPVPSSPIPSNPTPAPNDTPEGGSP